MTVGAARRSPPGCAPGQGLRESAWGRPLPGGAAMEWARRSARGLLWGGDAMAVASAVRRWLLGPPLTQ